MVKKYIKIIVLIKFRQEIDGIILNGDIIIKCDFIKLNTPEDSI